MKRHIEKAIIKLLRLPSRPSAMIAKYKLRKDMIVVEIGVSKGANAFDMLYHMKNIKRIYLVDPYIYKNGIDQHRIKGNLEDYKKHAKKLLERWKEKTIFIYEPFNLHVIPEVVDFVYIDGDHSTKAVISDILNGLAILDENGIIAGHDIHYDSVKKGVEKILGNNYERIKCDWWAMKARLDYDGE